MNIPYTIFLLNLIILLIKTSNGEMAERLKAPVLKTGKGATLSWVRIPVSPPLKLKFFKTIYYI